ncbi:MAG: transporter [Micrococcaceae bacterium]|nr:transporter [Micrococcaceae bacterium]
MSRHRGRPDAASLPARLEALEQAVVLGGDVLPEETLRPGREVLLRAGERRSLSAAHTVVGFFGATGSGKSSLVNAVSRSTVATVAARRPTTAEPLACIWGAEGSKPLLDWLGVGQRFELEPAADLAGEDAGLILLDLPDFDSIAASHAAVVDRLVAQVDVLVWVVDPQKYADAALHRNFLSRLSGHSAVTLVVLNQVDRLAAGQDQPVLESLARLLAMDGFPAVDVLPVSARTGAGVDELRRRIASVVQGRAAITQRLEADVAAAAAGLAGAAGEGEPAGVHQQDRRTLTDALAVAAHVPLVVDAVRVSYRMESVRRTGWPATRWLGRFRSDPLRRLNLKGRSSGMDRASLPPATAAGSSLATTAVRDFVEAAASGSSEPWRNRLRVVAASGREGLPGALERAVAGTDLRADAASWWWPVFAVLQWVAMLTAAAGLLWLAVLAVLGYFQLPVGEVPRVAGWAVPTVLVAAGVVTGIVLAGLSRLLAALAARARAGRARHLLTASVAEVAEALIAEPVREEVQRCRDFHAAVARAGGNGGW